MPAYRPLTIVLMILVVIASVQLIAPGLGKDWFGADFRPQGWAHAERFTYLWTELLPVLCFIAIGVFFWWRGRRTRDLAARLAAGVEPYLGPGPRPSGDFRSGVVTRRPALLQGGGGRGVC